MVADTLSTYIIRSSKADLYYDLLPAVNLTGSRILLSIPGSTLRMDNIKTLDMYRYTVIAIGKMKNRSLAALSDDFCKRLKRQGNFELLELKDGDVESEGQRILETLGKRSGARIFAMAEEGNVRSSRAFASELQNLQGQPAVFIIGGAYGLSEVVKQRADELFSLSPMTFTHEIARMLTCEQLYRAVSINSGSKYHHD